MYAFAVGTCFGCSATFTFNPVKVPSININGDRKPICRTCVERVNPLRIKNGLEPITLQPGAYEECHESEL
jgi:hypothetical protein